MQTIRQQRLPLIPTHHPYLVPLPSSLLLLLWWLLSHCCLV